MTSDDVLVASVDGLDQLRTLAPDPDRAERVRARCRTQLVRSQQRAARRSEVTGFATRVLGPVVLGAFCVFYTAVLVALTVQLKGIFH